MSGVEWSIPSTWPDSLPTNVPVPNAGNGAPVFTSMAVDLTVTNLLPLFAGRTVVHVLSDDDPGNGFSLVDPGLVDVYFSTLASSRRAAGAARVAARVARTPGRRTA